MAVRETPGSITLGEVASCVQSMFLGALGAVGGLGAIGKMIEQKGISEAVKLLGKFLIRNAGWVGALSMAISFGSCMINAYEH
jgi:hypothetical protein